MSLRRAPESTRLAPRRTLADVLRAGLAVAAPSEPEPLIGAQKTEATRGNVNAAMAVAVLAYTMSNPKKGFGWDYYVNNRHSLKWSTKEKNNVQMQTMAPVVAFFMPFELLRKNLTHGAYREGLREESVNGEDEPE